MREQIRAARLLERGGERVDQLVGQLADEADGVGQQAAVGRAEAQHARGRVERVEQPVAHPDLGARERVQQRRLAGVRVADERDRRQRRALALGALHRARALDVLEPPAQRRDAVAREAAVGLDLRLARAPSCRCRRRGARGGSTGRACARGCTRAGRAPPAACPRRCAAWEAKMSRITVVRSTTGRPIASSRLRSWRAVSSSSQAIRFASQAARGGLRLGHLARVRGRCSGAGCSRRWTSSPTTATPAVRSSSPSSARSSPSASAATQKARWRARCSASCMPLRRQQPAPSACIAERPLRAFSIQERF